MYREKMLRDRLRCWECKKNARKAGCSERRTTAPGEYGNSHRSARKNKYHPAYSELASLFQCTRESLYNPLHIPEEEKFLRQTLKSVLDWQLRFRETEEDWDAIWSSSLRFIHKLERMNAALYNLRICSIPAAIAIRDLRETSTEVEHSFETECTPLAMLLSMNTIAGWRKAGASQQICAATSNFLLDKATEALHLSNPALLLLRQMSLFEQSPETLAMIHEVGCVIFNSTSHPFRVLEFRAAFIGAANVIGLGAMFRPLIDVLIETMDEKNVDGDILLLQLADLHYQYDRSDECIQLARRCLDVLKIQGDETSWLACEAWAYIADAHEARSDFVSRADALRNALTVAELIEPDIASGSGKNQLYVSVIIFYLHECYRVQNKQDECEALRLQYPHVFAEA